MIQIQEKTIIAAAEKGMDEFLKVFTDARRVERETTDEEFTAMYVDFEQFDELEEKFFYIEEEETAIIAQYVDENLEDFAEIL
ncbi:MAG: DMP19 family protein [Porphyromonadaceae bacterium]|nr:DMP19 family protein [Porphyromonadaceae bacterium]